MVACPHTPNRVPRFPGPGGGTTIVSHLARQPHAGVGCHDPGSRVHRDQLPASEPDPRSMTAMKRRAFNQGAPRAGVPAILTARPASGLAAEELAAIALPRSPVVITTSIALPSKPGAEISCLGLGLGVRKARRGARSARGAQNFSRRAGPPAKSARYGGRFRAESVQLQGKLFDHYPTASDNRILFLEANRPPVGEIPLHRIEIAVESRPIGASRRAEALSGGPPHTRTVPPVYGTL